MQRQIDTELDINEGLPIESMRLLAFLAWSSFFTPLFVGQHSNTLFIIQTLLAVPLFLPLDATRLRGHVFWKFVSIFALLMFVLIWRYTYRRELAVFLLILFCLAFEYYGEKRDQAPIRLIGMLSFLVVLSQFRYENGLRLALGSTVYVVALVYVLISLHLGRLDKISFFVAFRQRFPSTIVHTTGVIVISLLIFWCLPRLSHHSFGMNPSIRGDSIRAFSNRVMLNDIGTLRLSKKHVLNVTPLNDEVHSPYLKGKILDLYNIDGLGNASWRLSSDERNMKFSRDGIYDFALELPDTQTYAYRIDVKPLIGNTLFYFNELVSIETKLKNMHMAQDMGGIHFPQMLPSSMTYIVKANKYPVEKSTSNHETYLQTIRDHTYLDDILNELIIDQNMPVQERIDRLLAYFQNRFVYSLEINNLGESDPIRYFLLDSQQGHCELFASSMALLLRRSGVPTRLVTGFMLGERAPGDTFFYVTESSAHAWLEAYYDQTWHTVDPTPASDALSPSFIEYRIAILERYWNDFILNWDAIEQKNLISSIRNQFNDLALNISSHKALVIYLIGTLVVLFFAIRFLIAFKYKTFNSKVLSDFERLHIGAWRPRKSWETWALFLDKSPYPASVKQAMHEFLQQYWAITYGHHPNKGLSSRLQEIKKLLRQKAQSGENP